MPSTLRAAWLACLLAASLPAQSWDTLRGLTPGTQVRVSETGGHRQSARWKSATDTSILLETGKGEVSIDKAKVSRVEVQSPGRRWRNAAIGAAIGVGVGLVIDQTLGARLRNESSGDGGRALSYGLPIAAFAGVGALLPGWHTVYRSN